MSRAAQPPHPALDEDPSRTFAEGFIAEAAQMLSSTLEYDETIARVAALAVPAFADWCMVDLLADDGESFDRVGVGFHRPGGEQIAAALRRRYRARPDLHSGISRAVADRASTLERDVAEPLLRAIARDDEHLRSLRALEARSFIVAPLLARGRPIGAISFIACERNFTEKDRWLAEQLAACAAGAIDNATLFAAEHRARQRIGRMQDVTAALSRARTAAEVADAACRFGSGAMEAHSGALWLLHDDDALLLAGTWGTPKALIDQFRVIPVDAKGTPAAEVARTGQPVWIETEDDYRRTAPDIFEKAHAAGHAAAYGAVPLSLDGRIGGVMVFSHALPHRYDESERGFYAALAQHCSQALDRARLLDAERRSNERLRLLAAAGETLAQSLDLDETLRTVARLAVPAFSDWCSIDMVEGKDVRRIATVHADPEKVRAAEELAVRYPSRVGDPSGIGKVIADGVPRFFPRLPSNVLEAGARDAQHRAFLQAAHMLSTIVLPLRAAHACIGAISFTTAESGRVYDQSDFDFAEELGRRAGLAITNARLYRAAQEAATHAADERRRAEEANRLKDEFLATVSHELRTPLNAIVGWASLLASKTSDPASLVKGLEVIQRNAQAQTRIVEDILDVSRIITGKLMLEAKPVDVAGIAREALEVVRPAADAKGVKLTLEATAACRVLGDAHRIQQVVWNLLSNAIKFTNEGGHVSARVEQAGPSVTFTVIDSGRGIDAEFLPYVFDRFRQADSSISRQFGGLGLGLAIVRHIVELHGGRVSASSAGAGKGATFQIVLPVRAVAAPPAAAENASAPEPSAPPPARAALSGVRVLVVDDELDARELVAVVLASAGAVVETAPSAQDAFDSMGRFRPDVIVSDIGMPGEDGYDFLRRVRARELPDGAAVPAVALTAYTRPEDRKRALAAGFNAHLTKPVEPSDLLAVIARLRGGGGREGARG